MLSWLSETAIIIMSMAFSAVGIQVKLLKFVNNVTVKFDSLLFKMLGIACTICLCRNLGEEFY